MFRHAAPAIGLFLGLAPVLAHAQTSIDQGKTPAEIFAIDCATCHKSARGLAHGKTSSELASFLAEHYTSGRDQAAALAAYVMGAGGGDAAPTQARGPKTQPETKPAETKPAEIKPPEPNKPPTRTAKPAETPAATAKLRPEEERKPPGATATRNRHTEPEPEPSAPQPATVVASPASSSAPGPEASPSAVPAQSAASPSNGDSGESAPVPRDDIPD